MEVTRYAKEQPFSVYTQKGFSMTAQESKGFEITFHEAKHLIRVRSWGCWDRELAKTYRHALDERIGNICGDDRAWNMLVDVRAFHPQSEDVQHMLNEQIDTASRCGIKKIAYLGIGDAAHIQLNRLFRKTEIPQYALFEKYEDAVQWLLK